MSMTLEESAALMIDPIFRSRVKAAVVTYAQYLALQAGNNLSKNKWIEQAFNQPDYVAGLISQPVVLNPNVQAEGAAVLDPDLQAAVQAVSDQMM